MFQSILNKSSKNTGLIISENFIFSFDINTSEQHSSTLKITENPIENGANIADHAVLEPKSITISGLVVGYEPNPIAVNNVSDFNFSDYPLAMPIKTVTDQEENMVNRFASYFQTETKKENIIIADFLPDYQSPKLNSVTSDRIADAYEKILAIQRCGQPVTLQTNVRQYKNMLITSVGLSQKQNTVGEFTLTFKEVFIVHTKIVGGLNIPDKKDKNLGKTQPEYAEIEDNEEWNDPNNEGKVVDLGKNGMVYLGKDGTSYLVKDGKVYLGKDGKVDLGKDGKVYLGKNGRVWLEKNGRVSLVKDKYVTSAKKNGSINLSKNSGVITIDKNKNQKPTNTKVRIGAYKWRK